MPTSTLVTGGAGYIGSHVALMLHEAGYDVVVLDDLSTGFQEAVLGPELVVGNCGDTELVTDILHRYNVDSVLHFAAHTIVPESVSNPLKYYGNNTCNSRKLLHACQKHGVRHFIFSSTAAVYGIPESGYASEETPTDPINPYGRSKLMTEWMLRDLSSASDMRSVVLRYFNVAGCDPLGRVGQSTKNATLLIKVVCEAVLGVRESVSVFGTDFPTPDGTGVRDYVHVHDLATAHINALEYLKNGGTSRVLNCGYGRGYSVREVVDAVRRVSGKAVNSIEMPRRPGDPPTLIAVADEIQSTLNWEPKYNDLDEIVRTSLSWESKLAELKRSA